MDSLWWGGIGEGVDGVNKAKQIPHFVRDDRGEGEGGVGETHGGSG
jgi:hypothetical protein